MPDTVFVGYDRDDSMVFRLPNGRLWCSIMPRPMDRALVQAQHIWDTFGDSAGVDPDRYVCDFGPQTGEKHWENPF